MKIEIGKTYEVSAYCKKSLTEVEQFKNDEDKWINTEVLWRNGTFFITITNEEEANELQSCLYIEGEQEDPEEWDYDHYEEIELDSTFDGCSDDFVFIGKFFTENEQEALLEEYEEQLEGDDWQSRYEFLEERGFESMGCCWYISGGVTADET